MFKSRMEVGSYGFKRCVIEMRKYQESDAGLGTCLEEAVGLVRWFVRSDVIVGKQCWNGPREADIATKQH